MTEKSKVLKITWLDACNKCGIGCYLFTGDAVYCPKCDNKGEIECNDCAYVVWEHEK